LKAQTPARLAHRFGRIAEGVYDGSRFMVQMAGQPPFEIFASSEREFFLNSFDARVTFEVDASGRATAIVMNTGTDQRHEDSVSRAGGERRSAQ
jgi:hypothetical protein